MTLLVTVTEDAGGLHAAKDPAVSYHEQDQPGNCRLRCVLEAVLKQSNL